MDEGKIRTKNEDSVRNSQGSLLEKMVCVIAFLVFAFLGIFSVKYRQLAKEAFACVFKRMTLRKCDTGFEEKIKAQITGRLLKRSTRLAKMAEKLYEPIAWLFVASFFVSLFFLGRGVYYYVKYGTCNPQSPTSCPFYRSATPLEKVLDIYKCPQGPTK